MADDRQQRTDKQTKPESCTEVPMTLEDIFIECTRPASDPILQESEV